MPLRQLVRSLPVQKKPISGRYGGHCLTLMQGNKFTKPVYFLPRFYKVEINAECPHSMIQK
jgi:hypothetical protein